MVSIVSNTGIYVYLKVAKREDLKSSHNKEKNFVTMCGDGC